MLKSRVAGWAGSVNSLDLSELVDAYAKLKHISREEAHREIVDFGGSWNDPDMPEPKWNHPLPPE